MQRDTKTTLGTVSRILLGAIAILILGSSSAVAVETVTLKNGQSVIADRVVINKDDTLTLFRKRMGLAKSDPKFRPPPDAVRVRKNGTRVPVWNQKKTAAAAPLKADESEEVVGRLSWTELSAVSLQRYFPKRWNALQQQPLPTVPTIATPPPSSATPLGSITAPVNHPSNHISVQSLVFSKQENDLFIEGVLVNLSSEDIFNVGALLHNVEMSLTEKADIAPKLAWGAKGDLRLKILLPPALDLQRDPLLLDIKCFDKPANARNRKDTLYIFKLSRLASGEFTLTPTK